MADQKDHRCSTLGLTGLTSNAMRSSPRRLSMAHLRNPGQHGSREPAINRTGHVDRHLRRSPALSGHRRRLR